MAESRSSGGTLNRVAGTQCSRSRLVARIVSPGHSANKVAVAASICSRLSKTSSRDRRRRSSTRRRRWFVAGITGGNAGDDGGCHQHGVADCRQWHKACTIDIVTLHVGCHASVVFAHARWTQQGEQTPTMPRAICYRVGGQFLVVQSVQQGGRVFRAQVRQWLCFLPAWDGCVAKRIGGDFSHASPHN